MSLGYLRIDGQMRATAMTISATNDIARAARLSLRRAENVTPISSSTKQVITATGYRRSGWAICGRSWAVSASNRACSRATSAAIAGRACSAFVDGAGLSDMAGTSSGVLGLSVAFRGCLAGNSAGMISGSLPGSDNSLRSCERVRPGRACSLVRMAERVRTSASDRVRVWPGVG